MKENPTADMSEIAKGVDDSYSAVQGNFTTKESEDEDEDSGSEAYPDEVLKVLRGLKDGEVADNIIETDTGYYVVRLDRLMMKMPQLPSENLFRIPKKVPILQIQLLNGWMRQM